MEKPGIQEKCVKKVSFQLRCWLLGMFHWSEFREDFHGLIGFAHRPMEGSLTRVTLPEN